MNVTRYHSSMDWVWFMGWDKSLLYFLRPFHPRCLALIRSCNKDCFSVNQIPITFFPPPIPSTWHLSLNKGASISRGWDAIAAKVISSQQCKHSGMHWLIFLECGLIISFSSWKEMGFKSVVVVLHPQRRLQRLFSFALYMPVNHLLFFLERDAF